MKVSELAAKFSLQRFTESTAAAKLFRQAACFGCGFVAAGGSVFGTYAPFGISAAAAVPFSGVFSSLFGSILGYFMLSGGEVLFVSAIIL